MPTQHELDEARAELAERDSVVAKLTAERDNMRAEVERMYGVLGRTVDEASAAVDDLRAEIERLRVKERSARAAETQNVRLQAEVATMLPVVEAARAWRAQFSTPDKTDWPRRGALIRAVDALDGRERHARAARRGCPHPGAPAYDGNPTIIGATWRTNAYEPYARSLDSWYPGWWDDDLDRMTPGLREIAVQRRQVTAIEVDAPSTPEATDGQ